MVNGITRLDPKAPSELFMLSCIASLAWLGRYGIDCGVVSGTNVEAGLLAQSRLAILPYNENISAAQWTALESFVAAGGKLLVYYLLPTRMEPLLGVHQTGWS
jgi:hypothetical protein